MNDPLETNLMIIAKTARVANAITAALHKTGRSAENGDFEIGKSSDNRLMFCLTVYGESKLLTLVGTLALDFGMKITRRLMEQPASGAMYACKWLDMMIEI